MDLNIIRIKWYIQLFIISMYFLDKTSCLTCNKPDLSILKKICIIRDYNIQQLPPNSMCTSIGLYGEKNSGTNPVSADIKDINKLRDGYPLVYINNEDFHSHIIRQIRPQNLDKYLKEKTDFIRANGINAVIFDKLYTTRDIQQVRYSLDRNGDQIRIHGFIRALKIQNPNVLIGLMVPYVEKFFDDINVAYYENVVDFYALSTVLYNICSKSTDIIAPLDRMNKTIMHMKSLGYIMEKCIITIDLHIYKFCEYANNGVLVCEIYSYEDYCFKNHDDDVCKDTLADYYQKGLFVNTYNMAGAIIQSITDDDFSSKCCCGSFSGLTVIDAGINGWAEPNITKCIKWGYYQKSCEVI